MRMMTSTFILLLLFSINHLWPQRSGTMSFSLKSAAFAEGTAIPKKHSCDGADVSPALEWSGAPAGTKTLALIADDPDAPVGTWTHWIAWNIPPDHSLPENLRKTETLADGTRQGKNDFRRVGYGGPCPPPGKPHRYFFKLYALDTKLDLKPGSSRSELDTAIKGHVLGHAEVMGKFGR